MFGAINTYKNLDIWNSSIWYNIYFNIDTLYYLYNLFHYHFVRILYFCKCKLFFICSKLTRDAFFFSKCLYETNRKIDIFINTLIKYVHIEILVNICIFLVIGWELKILEIVICDTNSNISLPKWKLNDRAKVIA